MKKKIRVGWYMRALLTTGVLMVCATMCFGIRHVIGYINRSLQLSEVQSSMSAEAESPADFSETLLMSCRQASIDSRRIDLYSEEGASSFVPERSFENQSLGELAFSGELSGITTRMADYSLIPQGMAITPENFSTGGAAVYRLTSGGRLAQIAVVGLRGEKPDASLMTARIILDTHSGRAIGVRYETAGKALTRSVVEHWSARTLAACLVGEGYILEREFSRDEKADMSFNSILGETEQSDETPRVFLLESESSPNTLLLVIRIKADATEIYFYSSDMTEE